MYASWLELPESCHTMSNSTAVSGTTTFQERMFERIKSNMGDLMTDEELAALVEKTIEKAFFEPRVTTVRGDYGRTETKTEDSVFVVMMREEVRLKIEAHAKARVDEWFAANPGIFKEQVDAAIARGFAQVVLDQINMSLRHPLAQLSQQVTHMVQNNGRAF